MKYHVSVTRKTVSEADAIIVVEAESLEQAQKLALDICDEDEECDDVIDWEDWGPTYEYEIDDVMDDQD